MKTMLGDLPLGRGGNLNHVKTADKFGFTRKQLTKLYWCWRNAVCGPNGKGSTLTFCEYITKTFEANITPDQIGRRKDQYNLARVGDSGGDIQ